MKRIGLTFLFLASQLVVFGQWIQQNSGTVEDLRSVQFLDLNVGYIVGNNGTILKTTNSGNNWQQLISNTTVDLQALCFLDEAVGFVAGSNFDFDTEERHGVLLMTRDGGESWERLNFSKEEQILDIWFINEHIGYLSCRREGLYRTIDGGINWTKVSSKPTRSVYFITENLGYSLMGKGIAKTEDGGDTWIQKKDENSPDYNPADILITLCFTSSEKGYFGSSYYGGLYSTIDGANSLELNGLATVSIDFPTKKIGYIVGRSDGTGIYQTTDAGKSWNLIHTPSTNMNDLSFVSNSMGWIIGNEGKILRYDSMDEFEEELQDKILIYPNPGKGYLNVEIESELGFKGLKLYNSVGQLVRSYDEYEKVISINTLSTGTYFLRIETETGGFTQKVSIQ